MKKARIFLLLLSLSVVSCSDDDKNEIVLDILSHSMYVNETVDITANQDCSWFSEKNFIASVNSEGVVTAHHVGSTRIAAASENGIVFCDIEVKPRYTTFTDPVLEFGKDKDYIKSRVNRPIKKEEDNYISYEPENN